MGWFSKKKEKELRYVFIGLRESKQLKSELSRFYELQEYFLNSEKIYTKSELSQISAALSKENGSIDVFESFVWLDEHSYQSRTEPVNLKMNAENLKEVEVDINTDILDFLFFEYENQKINLINQLKQVIKVKKNSFNSPDFKTIMLNEAYEELFGTPPSFLLQLFIIEVTLYTIWHIDGVDHVKITKKVDYINSDFKEKLKGHKDALKWNLVNLKRKINISFQDISTEEKIISDILFDIDDYNVNPFGYDILDAIIVLGLYYMNFDIEKGTFYIEKANCSWTNISNNTVSYHFKNVGEAYYKTNQLQSALTWFKKGLEINPKLNVKKIIAQIEKTA